MTDIYTCSYDINFCTPCSADGNFEVTLETKAQLDNRGTIQWKPPAIYKSFLRNRRRVLPIRRADLSHEIRLLDLRRVDLRHKDEVEGTNRVELGIDLSEFYLSVEWDILDVPAIRNEKFYTCCEEPYIDITFQHQHASQDALLHGQPHYSVHGHVLPDGARLLPALGLGGRRSLSPSPSCSRSPSSSCCWPRSSCPPHSWCPARQVPALHHDPRYTLHLRHSGRAQRPLQKVTCQKSQFGGTYENVHSPRIISSKEFLVSAGNENKRSRLSCSLKKKKNPYFPALFSFPGDLPEMPTGPAVAGTFN
ncbi:acetylcholine receptor subunit alpha-like [Caerostris extrusa]|uniref:Acetylcholine receptor subunit alpha-like n=1 Tax=Caerostris extrusa TaxID=172846 RepID=A0AAV4N6J8_CAEEX|nr:acetylcholine receptor subunit alpha-like [Caerostris extrusa]